MCVWEAGGKLPSKTNAEGRESKREVGKIGGNGLK
jgi:hypothetical protein